MYTFTTQECTFFDAKSTYSCIKGYAKGCERVNSVKNYIVLRTHESLFCFNAVKLRFLRIETKVSLWRNKSFTMVKLHEGSANR